MSPLPETLHVEVTTRCNLSCVFCKQGEAAVRARGELPLSTFVDLLEQLGPGCRRVNLWGTGEPLLNGGTLDMARHAAQQGVPRIKLSTNGTLLSAEMVESLLASGVTSVRVALDSTAPDEFRTLRGGNVHQILAGIERLVQARNRTARQVKIVVATVVTGQSADCLRQVRDLVARLGADGHELMPNIWASQFPLSGGPASERCDQPLRVLNVLANGDVIPCCHSLMGEVILGNVYRSSVRKIWDGIIAHRTRGEFVAGRFPLCAGCNFGITLDREGKPCP